jgi:radical SAM protein with 4Fe4S-binding SPASM domain
MEVCSSVSKEVLMVSEDFISSRNLQDLSLWKVMELKRLPFLFDLEVTARCNLNCRHCYINLAAADRSAASKELSLDEIREVVDEAVSLGALWCVVTGGEPLLRDDFLDMYLYLKGKGLLVSVFTNATLVNHEHVGLFKRFPPRDIEVSVYGIREETYERITRRRGSFAAFRRGLDLLVEGGLNVRLKAMFMRSNVHEQHEIARFCRQRTRDFYRFDPFLHLRYDRDPVRNREILSERLAPQEIAALESSDPERFRALKGECDKPFMVDRSSIERGELFLCGAGKASYSISYDGMFRLCSSLWHPYCVYDLRQGNLTHAWRHFAPRVREMRSERVEYLRSCSRCDLINLCMWCPAHAYLETGQLDAPVEYFCQVAHARASALGVAGRSRESAGHWGESF